MANRFPTVADAGKTVKGSFKLIDELIAMLDGALKGEDLKVEDALIKAKVLVSIGDKLPLTYPTPSSWGVKNNANNIVIMLNNYKNGSDRRYLESALESAQWLKTSAKKFYLSTHSFGGLKKD